MKSYFYGIWDNISNPPSRKRLYVKAHAAMFGASREKRGLVGTFLLYFTLISLALVYVAPIVAMISTSLMDNSDLMNPTIRWIPRRLEWSNYAAAYRSLVIMPETMFVPGLTFWESIRRSTAINTLIITVPTAVIQVFSCAVAGYAFGRLNFPLKRIFFVLLVLVFIVPPQAQLIPLIWTYRGLGLLNSPLVFYAPAVFGHGVRGALFVFVYMQFFRKLPKDLEEAAMVDGVNPFKIFYKIMVPLAKPAFMVVFLFSLVYHWTETVFTSTLYRMSPTLSTRIMTIMDPHALMIDRVGFQTIRMATGVIMVAPLIIVYFFTQKTFTESIERTGLVE